jgi:hypothetical protein
MKINYNGIYFNAEWAASKTQAEFIEHEKHQDLTHDQLAEVHALAKKAVENKPAPEPIKPVLVEAPKQEEKAQQAEPEETQERRKK